MRLPCVLIGAAADAAWLHAAVGDSGAAAQISWVIDADALCAATAQADHADTVIVIESVWAQAAFASDDDAGSSTTLAALAARHATVAVLASDDEATLDWAAAARIDACLHRDELTASSLARALRLARARQRARLHTHPRVADDHLTATTPTPEPPEPRELIDALPGIVWSAPAHGMADYLNARWYQYTENANAPSMPPPDAVMAALHPDDRPRAVEAARDGRRQRAPYAVELRLRAADGSYRWFLLQAQPMLGADGAVARWIGVATDIAARRAAEERLRDRETTLRLALDVAGLYVSDVDFTRSRMLLSPEFAAWLGLPAESDLHEAWSRVHPDDRALAEARFIASDGKAIETQHRLVTPAGEKWVLAKGALVDGTPEAPRRAIFITQDMTDRHAAELRLRESATLLSLAQRAARAGAFDWHVRDDEAIATAEYRALYGLMPTEPITFARWLAQIHADDRERVRRDSLAQISSTREYTLEFRIDHPVRGLRHLLTIGQVERAPDGSPERLFGVTLDVTDRRQIERLLAQSQDREGARLAELESLYRHAPIGLCQLDADLRFVRINERLAQMNGLSVEAHLGRHVDDVVPTLAQTIREVTGRIVATGAPVLDHEFTGETPAEPGRRRSWREGWYPVRAPDGRITGFGVVVEETTQARDAEQSRRASEQALAETNRQIEQSFALLQTLFDSAPIGLAFLDRQFRYVRINEVLAALNNVPVPAHFGRTVEQVVPHIWPAVAPYLRQVIETQQPIANVSIEAPVPARDGPGFWLAGYYPIIVRGELIGVGIAAIDVTEEKLARRALQEADARKDAFLATLAHELRNPLAPIAHATQVLRMTQTDERTLQLLAVVERQVRHMTRLIDDLLDVSRITRSKINLDRKPVDLREAITVAIETARPLIDQRGHELLPDVRSTPTVVIGDPVRLAQVVTNLLTNAAKFTPPGGRIAVSLMVERECAVLRVRDSGIGLTATQAADVFGMFTQVRAGGDSGAGGLGIGLWLVRQLVELHGGSVVVRSDGPGCGSEFEVRIPLAGAAVVSQALPGYVEPMFALGKRILVVDDNRDAADTLADLLRHAGNEVHVVHTGLEAVAAFERNPPAIVLLDIGLPDIDGFEVCRRLRCAAGGPHARVIAVSGWGQTADRERAHDAGFDLHLTKPVDITQLRSALMA